jgi:hypothetical protein
MEKTLHVFEMNDCWIVAYDQEDAWDFWKDFTGQSKEDMGWNEWRKVPGWNEWRKVPDDHRLFIYIGEHDLDGREAKNCEDCCKDYDYYEWVCSDGECKTCATWISQNGHGWLCGGEA